MALQLFNSADQSRVRNFKLLFRFVGSHLSGSHCHLLQQPHGRIADERLGVAAVHAQHLKRLVAGLIADFQQVHTA